MREIKFRWFRKEPNPEMIYGSLEDITLNRMNFQSLIDTLITFDGVRNKVMQYTGLKDKNGKEIYECDLLEDGKKQIGEVFYKTDSAQFAVNWKMRDGSYETDSCMGYGHVVGNKFENPELLKG